MIPTDISMMPIQRWRSARLGGYGYYVLLCFLLSTYETCLKLVVYHQLMDRYYKGGFHTSYSRDSEFMDAIKNTDIDTLLATVDELMDCLALINPKLYNTVLAKLRG